MYKQKTLETPVNITKFINSFSDSPQKTEDSFKLIELMSKWSGFEPKMWGPSIIGFGKYHYKYTSGHEGDSSILGFSPRKTAISLYVFMPTKDNGELLKHLGKYKMGKACIYVKKLSDIDLEILEKMCHSTTEYIKVNYQLTQ